MAIGIDYRPKLNIENFADDVNRLKERVTNLESRHIQLDSQVRRLGKTRESEDMLVIFDYQNFSSTCSSRGLFLHPEQVVDMAAKYRTVTPRNIVQALIVDFDSSRHHIWKQHKDFKLYRVPDMCPGYDNPTDWCLYKATIETINALQLRRGSVVVIVSGDHHFIPLLTELKTRGYQTMVVSYFPGDTSENMIGNSDYYINLVSPTPVNLPATAIETE